MMDSTVTLLNEHLKNLGKQLTVFRQYYQTTDKPYVNSALSFVIEDTQEAIARTASRLRQLGEKPTGHLFEEAAPIKIRRAHRKQPLADKVQFVWRSLEQRLDWYTTHVNSFKDDADSQAILVALAEQTRVRLERWENLMDEMKVSPGE